MCNYEAQIAVRAIPEVKNTQQSTKKACHHDQSSAVINGSAPTQRQRRRSKDTHPSPKTPRTHSLPLIVWPGSIGVRGGQRVTTGEFDNFSILVTLKPYQPLPIEWSSREQQGHHNTSSPTCPSFAIAWWPSYKALCVHFGK